MLLYPDDGKVINMLDTMEILRKFKKSKQDKYVKKLQEWHTVYNNLGTGWLFSGGCVAVKTEERI
jgi:hypothetical protein